MKNSKSNKKEMQSRYRWNMKNCAGHTVRSEIKYFRSFEIICRARKKTFLVRQLFSLTNQSYASPKVFIFHCPRHRAWDGKANQCDSKLRAPLGLMASHIWWRIQKRLQSAKHMYCFVSVHVSGFIVVHTSSLKQQQDAWNSNTCSIRTSWPVAYKSCHQSSKGMASHTNASWNARQHLKNQIT